MAPVDGHDLLATAASLAVDRVTAEAVTALQASGIDVLVLKGPALVRWLYGDGKARPYGDTDLLIEERDLPRAQAVLRQLGFKYGAVVDGPDSRLDERTHWTRGRNEVDLHVTLLGIDAAPAHVWECFAATAEELHVAGTRVKTLGRSAAALAVVLHAAQHGTSESKPLEDLRRAIDIADDATWDEAWELARRLDAEAAFAAGLDLLRQGADLASRLGVPAAPQSVRRILRAEGASSVAYGFERLHDTPGLRRRAALLLHEVFPAPIWMRSTDPRARRGHFHLVLAYVRRWLRLARQVVPAYRSWRNATSRSK